MTFAIKDENGNRTVVINRQPDGICELCGKKAETRPYGPNGENICYECGMKDEKMTEKRFNQVMFGDGLDS